MVGVASGALPRMLAGTKKLDDLDLASEGERFGKAIGDAASSFAKAFKDADLVGTANEFAAIIGRVGQVKQDANAAGAAARAFGKNIGLHNIGKGIPFIDNLRRKADERAGEGAAAGASGASGSPDGAEYKLGKRSSFFRTPDPRGMFAKPANVFGLKPEVRQRLDNLSFKRHMIQSKLYGKDPSTQPVLQSLDAFRAGIGGMLGPSSLKTGGLTTGTLADSGGLGRGAYGAVRRGDAARRKEEQNKKTKDEEYLARIADAAEKLVDVTR